MASNAELLAYLLDLDPVERKRYFLNELLISEEYWLRSIARDIQAGEYGYTLANLREQRRRVQWLKRRLKSLPSPNIK